MLQRNYNLAFGNGEYVSNSFQSRLRNVLSCIEGALTENQRENYQTNQISNILRTYAEYR